MADIVVYDSEGNAKRFALASDNQMPSGKRAIVRNYRATNATDQGRIRTATWELATPIGFSKESTSGQLGCDYVQNLETRFPRRLISKGARNAIPLTTEDPVGVSNTLKLGQFKLGSVTAKLGGAVSTSDTVTHFLEFQGYMYAYRGRLGTQVQISNWTPVDTTIFAEEVQGATTWYGKGRVGLGAAAPMQTLIAASASGSVYQDTADTFSQPVYAGPLVVGTDRCWFITKGATGELENLAAFTLNDFETIANPFVIGDPAVRANGIGAFGPFTFMGMRTNIYSFTDQAKKIPLSRALKGHSSENNGKQFADPGWGWLYGITDIGLRALSSHIDNPVGVGEAMVHFTGHGGTPTAIFEERGELFVVYQTAAGDSYGYRARFGPETANTGQPVFYPWWYRASTDCQAIFSTNTPTDTAVVWGEGTNMAYETISRDGRDDLFSSRVYDTGGGTWYGTELDRNPHLTKTWRLGRSYAKSMTSGSSWTLAVSFDGDTYLDVGTMTTTGFHTLRPLQVTGTPLLGISGRSMKPRLTQVAAGSGASTTPPELAGTLEVEYDERPDYITEVACTVIMSGTNQSVQGIIESMEGYRDAHEPLKVRLPDDTADKWAMVQQVSNNRDLKDENVTGIDLILQLWDTE